MSLVYNNPSSTPSAYTQDPSSGLNDLVRLVEDSEVVKKIQFDEISIDANNMSGTPNGDNQKMSEIGLSFPIIRINDTVVSRFNLKKMTLSMRDFIPTISLTLVYDNGNFVNKNMPKDGDIISLYIRTDTAAMSYIRNDYIITSCTPSAAVEGQKGSTVHLSGELFVPGLNAKQFTAAYTGTSKMALRDIALTYGIGFAFNDYDDTDDFQNWIQCKENLVSFIKDITKHAWKDETSFFDSWIDIYYNLCFVNVNKFLLTSENDELVDITLATNTINAYHQTQVDSDPNNAMLTVKMLTNHPSFIKSPFYINRWEPVNRSTAVSMSTGYSTYTYTYLHNQNLINGGDYDCFEILNNIPAYDPNKTDSYMLLRGRNSYDASTNPDSEMARVNYDFVNTYNSLVYTGVEYVMSDDDKDKNPNQWSGNVHKNYNRAPFHNTQNLSELDKMFLVVKCDGLNLQIMKGERVPVYLVFSSSIENDAYNAASENDEDRPANRLYTGYYIVTSIEYDYDPGRTPNPYNTTFVLKRREWPTPEAIAKDENKA